MPATGIFLDTDVIVNWLAKETETASVKELWIAPFEIINHLEETPEKLEGFISITTILELRYLLRRKKRYSPAHVEKDIGKIITLFEIGKIITLFEVVIPDTSDMLHANSLQAAHSLDPFDAIQLSLCLSLKSVTLVSRDKEFLDISKKFIPSYTPEDFLSVCPL